MISSRVKLDTVADFSGVQNGSVQDLIDSGINLRMQQFRDPSLSGVATKKCNHRDDGRLNLDVETEMVSGEDVFLNWSFVVVDDLNFDFSIGMDVLSQCSFGVGRDSLWIGNVIFSQEILTPEKGP